MLTIREKELCQLVSEGKSNKEIARIMSISEQTVKNHLFNVMSKLRERGVDISNRTKLAFWYIGQNALEECSDFITKL